MRRVSLPGNTFRRRHCRSGAIGPSIDSSEGIIVSFQLYIPPPLTVSPKQQLYNKHMDLRKEFSKNNIHYKIMDTKLTGLYGKINKIFYLATLQFFFIFSV